MTKRIGWMVIAVAVLGIGGQAALAGDGHHRGYGRPGGDRFYNPWTPRAAMSDHQHARAYSRSQGHYYYYPGASSSSRSRIMGVPNAGGHRLWLRF